MLASYVIAPMLAGFRQRYPRIVLDIEVETLSEPPVEDFDIALMGADSSFDGDIVARKVIDSEAILVASPAYAQRRGLPQTPAALADHDCLRKAPGTHPTLATLAPGGPGRGRGDRGAPVVQANHTDTLLRAVLDGAGITSVSVEVVAPYLTRGDLVRVLQPWITAV